MNLRRTHISVCALYLPNTPFTRIMNIHTRPDHKLCYYQLDRFGKALSKVVFAVVNYFITQVHYSGVKGVYKRHLLQEWKAIFIRLQKCKQQLPLFSEQTYCDIILDIYCTANWNCEYLVWLPCACEIGRKKLEMWSYAYLFDCKCVF